MYKEIFSFVNILFLSMALKVSSAQTEKLSILATSKFETKPDDETNVENAFYDIELENNCNYIEAGQKFNDEINSVEKCVNPNYKSKIEKDRKEVNIIKTENTEYVDDDRTLTSLENPESKSEEVKHLLSKKSDDQQRGRE
ncbi:uncharacterized protein LOC117173555 isoform X2 [Belonocnema kinseyi]|uniref:uncharacterized protein LOC117173555 isoform X2 n=1 Tax=Belonocnema kinseyi TaxID=2817044 RepID=UPI00143CC523|nr:uncharacterized protein LOC117173555 isoform X2 [Belonocnema kinseyi]